MGYIRCGRDTSEKIGLPVKVGNDANVAALVRCGKAAVRDVRMVVMVTLEPGVGGGISY